MKNAIGLFARGLRGLPFVLLLLLPLALVAGCRAVPPGFPAPPPSPTSKPATAGPMVLTLWHSETGAARQVLEQLVSEFSATYPEILVTAEYRGNSTDLTKSLIAAVASNSAPALALIERRDTGQFVRQDGLMALDSFLADLSVGLTEDDRSDFFPGMLTEGQFPDYTRMRALPTPTPPPPTEEPPEQPIDYNLVVRATPTPTPGPAAVPMTVTYAIPFSVNATVLYVNLDLVRAKFPGPPASWTDFSRMGRELTKGDVYGWAVFPSGDLFHALVLANGGQLVDDNTRRARFNGRAGLQTVAVIAELTRSGAVQLYDDREGARRGFANGKAAFLITGSDELDAITQLVDQSARPFSWAVTMLPTAPDVPPTTLMSGRDLVVFKTDSDRARAAWFFIRWMTASKQAANWTRATHAIPLRASALSFLSGELATDSRLRQLKDTLGGTAPVLVPRNASRYATRIDDVLVDLQRQIANVKDLNLQAALDSTAARVTQLLIAP